jgi:predicted aminopeptidase
MQVGIEHLRYMGRARPIADELVQTADPERRAKLELVLDVRRFALAQSLDVGGSYLEVADTTGLATAYVVTAAHQDRLEPYQWSYPVVGKIPYRGYFDRGEAEAFGRSLEEDGFDTYIVEAAGYSTLGWLDDPLPSGLLDYDFVGVAEVIFHELVHQTLFVAGHIDFNETLASAVSGRLTIEFFLERAEPERVEVARRRHQRWREQADALDELAEKLDRYFADHASADRPVLLEGRSRIYEEALPRLAALGLEAPAPPEPGKPAAINNAVLLSWRRYRRHAAAFDAYLADFPLLARAFDELRTTTKDVDDPFTAIEPRDR